MKIGLFFGSFNPIHHGHLIICNFVRQNTDLQQVWLVVSPQNPLKETSSLLNDYHRLALVQLAIQDEPNLKAVDIEFHLPRPSYTINTLTYLGEKYPGMEFALVMGSDSYTNLPKWKNFEALISNWPIYVYNRPGIPQPTAYPKSKTNFLKAPLLELSATHIRNSIREGKSIRFLVPEKVKEEIERNGYYK
jgi:nicotinate-nucleotide adenylyltransferase